MRYVRYFISRMYSCQEMGCDQAATHQLTDDEGGSYGRFCYECVKKRGKELQDKEDKRMLTVMGHAQT